MLTRNGNGSDGIVIVGGGLAGQRCAEALRRHGYDGPLRMVCAEAHRPYDRPPLSKQLLAGAAGKGSSAYRDDEWYERESVDLLLGIRATALNTQSRRIELSDGKTLAYGRALIATGARALTLPVLAGYDNVSTLRTIDDCRRLHRVVRSGATLAVVGAGFVGQEVAATARRCGCAVTMIEAAPTPLAGLLGPRIGAWFADLHRSEGVCMRTGRTIASVDGRPSVNALHLSDGSSIQAAHVVVGVGVAPDVDWLRSSGLAADRVGVPVDHRGGTQAPGVWAAGDAAAAFDARAGCHLPGSHWEAAARQGSRAAQGMLGLDPPPELPTGFWTDQYGLRIQYVGYAPAADAVEITGKLEDRSFVATYTRSGRAVAALLVNRPGSLRAARQAIAKGTTPG